MNTTHADMELLSNSMATYAHLKDNMESFALYFMLGVCSGLLVALCLLVSGLACRLHVKQAPCSPDRWQLRESSEEDDDADDGGDETSREKDDEEAKIPRVMVAPMSDLSQSNCTLQSVNVFTSAAELEKARRLEERERIVREIWRNGQPDILATGTGTLYTI
ncbi:hypothetical protein ACEWY4_024509 [Coilia grayii]|uniref:EVA1 domain-containing protein n=1 Tax=Coilia grayii TaxID=363190 RepID=A0ABD1J259_9TELE